MQASVDLRRMTLSEKLGLMESLWDELCRREKDIPVPDWHKQVLDERERQIKEGKAKFTNWSSAKKRIAKRIS